jgi:signal transduction histidine kinase
MFSSVGSHVPESSFLLHLQTGWLRNYDVATILISATKINLIVFCGSQQKTVAQSCVVSFKAAMSAKILNSDGLLSYAKQAWSDAWEPKFRILVSRRLIVAGMCLAALLSGSFTYLTIHAEEKERSNDDRYNSLSKFGLHNLKNNFHVKKEVLSTLSKSVSYYHPNISDWPNVVVPGFYDSVASAALTANLSSIGMVPIVVPEKLQSYESFIQKYVQSEPAFPPDTGEQHFGFGVYSYDRVDGSIYREITGEMENSTKIYITPQYQILFTKDITHERVGLNVRSIPAASLAMDDIIECSQLYQYKEASQQCAMLLHANPLPRPTAVNPNPVVENYRVMLMFPIYLNQNSSNLVGFLGGVINWDLMLGEALPDDVTGLDWVIDDGHTKFTYTFRDGGIHFTGQGDLHDKQYDTKARSALLYNGYGGASVDPCLVTVYPTDSFYASQLRGSSSFGMPLYVSVVSSLVIFACVIVFWLYDLLVRREHGRQEQALHTKRTFVRFVSHEVRTPLNATTMGLQLLVEEMRKACDLEPLSQVQSPSPSGGLGIAGTESGSQTSEDSREVLTSNQLSLRNPQVQESLENAAELFSESFRGHDKEMEMVMDMSSESLRQTMGGRASLRQTMGEWLVLLADLVATNETAVDVLNDLLNYDSIEVGSLRLDLACIPLWTMVKHSCSVFRAPALQRSIQLKFFCTDSVSLQKCAFIGDRSRVSQIIRNLLSNALKFTPDEGCVTVTRKFSFFFVILLFVFLIFTSISFQLHGIRKRKQQSYYRHRMLKWLFLLHGRTCSL